MVRKRHHLAHLSGPAENPSLWQARRLPRLTPQRTVISITDAIIGGEGEGPLANTPMPSGFVTAALNAAAAEWVHARLMGFDPEKIPLIREAFGNFDYPLTDFSPDSIRVWIGDTEKSAQDILPIRRTAPLCHPAAGRDIANWWKPVFRHVPNPPNRYLFA